MSPRAVAALLLVLAILPRGAQAQDGERDALEAAMFGAPVEAATPTATTSSTATSTGSDAIEAREAALFGAPGDAGTEAREADLFGGPATGPGSPSELRPAEAAPGLGEGSGSSTLDRMEATLDRTDDVLAIGGRVFSRLDYRARSDTPAEEAAIAFPSLVDLYLDARPNTHLRTYLRGRLSFDPTVVEGQGFAGFGGAEKLRVQLDQLWLKLDVAQQVFVTVGRQRVKWGAGRFWNPSDFLNQAVLDPLQIFDLRLGADLLKVHVPVESIGANFYAVAGMTDAAQLERVQGALRAELVVGPAELTATALFARDQPLRLAADVSSGLGPFDVRVEAVLRHGERTPEYRRIGDASPFDSVERLDREDRWIPQLVANAELGLAYGDDDSVNLGVEYFYNGLGTADEALLPFLLVQGELVPLYAGQHYAAIYVALLAPLSFDDTSIFLSALGNLSDRSFVLRYDHRVRVLTYLQLNLYAQGYLGSGELRLGLELPAGAVPGLPTGLSVPPPMIDLGVGLTLDW